MKRPDSWPAQSAMRRDLRHDRSPVEPVDGTPTRRPRPRREWLLLIVYAWPLGRTGVSTRGRYETRERADQALAQLVKQRWWADRPMRVCHESERERVEAEMLEEMRRETRRTS